MELTDPAAEALPSSSSRSPLFIDLNEIPSSSSSSPPACSGFPDPLSYDIVRSFHDNPDPPPGPPAALPSSLGSLCEACGKPEVRGHVVVCDGCERGFHLECAGRQTAAWAPGLVEWLCGDCVGAGAKSKLWPLGVKSKRILDINSSPPGDGDLEALEEEEEELHDLRVHSSADPLRGNSFDAPSTNTNAMYSLNGYGARNDSELAMHVFREGFEDIVHHKEAESRNINEVGLRYARRRFRNRSSNSAARVPSQRLSEVFLQNLREFISGKHGVLEEGWNVEFKNNDGSDEQSITYCSPDGKAFGSVYEVAFHLGLMANCNQMDADGSLCLREKMQLPRKRKSRRFKLANGFAGSKDNMTNGYCHESSNSHCMEVDDSNINGIAEVVMLEDGMTELQPSNEALPLQFEDFFVLSFGKLDLRPTYHDVSLVSPVGFRSCWHDMVTGSLFVSEVLDGGDSGPLFKVRRFSCSALPTPDGSTILFRSNLVPVTDRRSEEFIDKFFYSTGIESNDDVAMIFSDLSPPTESDVLICLKDSSNESCGVQRSDNVKSSFLHRNSSSSCPEFGGEIGEICVEERSSSSAWRMMSQKVVDAYSDLLEKGGVLKLCCSHFDDAMHSHLWCTDDDKGKISFAPLAKFHGYPWFAGIPMVYQGEFDTLSPALSRWLAEDRFGLDTDFVQEIIEKFPEIEVCSKYEHLDRRCHFSKALTVGNGFLVAERRDGPKSNDSSRRSKKPRLAEDSMVHDGYPPAGRLLCSQLPPFFVGDFFQVWEVLWRFRGILGLGETLLYEELEEELIDPWSDNPYLPENLERKVKSSQVVGLCRADGMTECATSSCNVASLADLRAFVEIETGVDAAKARLASVTYTSCCGVALTKAHCSLVNVLISELQSKVAALVDPNFDTGEPKSRRGRRKDVDSSILERKNKLSMLPINNLTWPELARRYILAVLCMDGNLDSTEITTRESNRVFCCLQGDGGLLCGSIAGIVGMEADALLLAEATKQIFGSLSRGKELLMEEGEETDVGIACQKSEIGDGNMPEWAKKLEPVRKLPTNVGTRIRRCVYEALNESPPEWARKRLEHSISKEVYKGNASGPTKKAVLAVLADLLGEGLQQKPVKKNKRMIAIPISDVIMKQCRIVLRHAAAADEGKAICTLLGRILKSSSDNDDEGLLGSPAMVSRPLDFRTIDLRLAVGSYGGSCESFLEDVQELWNTVRTAFGDQPDMLELAETLSQNFESLYEKEVMTLVRKFEEYAKLDQISSETKKEIDEVLASTNNIPKAPWDEGICKVCGVDKDDDSVLLCDTCDAEYHTYCLNPPLARIPEGNWYCPSCIGVHMAQEALGNTQVFGKSCRKKYQGEVTRGYLEMLTYLAAVMEEREYWEFSVDERIFLLKFLCDEFLNSALVRQHLEQCAETAAELQQKLRSLSIEWKNLKSREACLVAQVTKTDTDAVGLLGAKESLAIAKEGMCETQPNDLGTKPHQCVALSNDVMVTEGGQEKHVMNGFDKGLSPVGSRKIHCCDMQTLDSLDGENQMKEMQMEVDESELPSPRSDRSLKKLSLLSNHLQQDSDETGEEQFQDNMQGCGDLDISAVVPSPVRQESSEMNNHVAEHLTSISLNGSQTSHSELNTVKREILHLQDSVFSTESELLKLSLWREYLGCDSRGRLYWASVMPGKNPLIIVDGSLSMQRSVRSDDKGRSDDILMLKNSASSSISNCFNLEGLSKACFQFLHDPGDGTAMCSPWVFYETDAELKGLVNWLTDNDRNERLLKKSILQWMRARFHEPNIHSSIDREECQETSSAITSTSGSVITDNLVTKAAVFLEKKYGSFVKLDTVDMSKKRGKKSRLTEEKMYRCDCLEPIWPSRYHCLSCHRTVASQSELEEHNNGKCCLIPPPSRKTEDINCSSIVKGNGQPKTDTEECINSVDMIKTHVGSELTLRLVDNEWICPFDFEVISSRFVTEDSNMELVKEIGFIGSHGTPSFISSVSPYLSDAMLMLVSSEEGRSAPSDESNVANISDAAQGGMGKDTSLDIRVDGCSRKSVTTEISNMKTNKASLECLKRRERKSSADKRVTDMGSYCHCVVPQSSLQPLVGKVSYVLRRLKACLLDMEAALGEEAFRLSRAQIERRWAWREFVKSAVSIYQMVQATIVLEEMIRTQFLRNEWWYWSSLSAAAKTSTITSLALRIYSLDAVLLYDKCLPDSDSIAALNPRVTTDERPSPGSDLLNNCRITRKSNRKRKEPEG